MFRASGVEDAHAHRFRHTLATEILANGGTLADVADILGISEWVARKHYAKWNQARQDRIAAFMTVIHSGTKRAHKKNCCNSLILQLGTWCPGWDLNPHGSCLPKDFKSFASADFATRACSKRSIY